MRVIRFATAAAVAVAALSVSGAAIAPLRDEYTGRGKFLNPMVVGV